MCCWEFHGLGIELSEAKTDNGENGPKRFQKILGGKLVRLQLQHHEVMLR
jgi:hypothetical protein